ncbi:MAG: anthranilate synthase component I [Thaumarchaeota archaeon]|nr:anthranilate synthase component I [Nitrososphaerota archaeon]
MTTFGTTATTPLSTLKTEKLETRDSPQQLFSKVQEEYQEAFLLESAKGATRLAEYSFIGFEPSAVLRVKNGQLEVEDRLTGGRERRKTSDPLEAIRASLGPLTKREGPHRFIGGAVGYISYDSVRYWERIPAIAKDDLSVPDMEFGIYTDGVTFDHSQGRITYHSLGEDRSQVVRRLLRGKRETGSLQHGPRRPNIPKEKYERMVEKAKEYITAGDIFQVVPSKRNDFEVAGDLTRFYAELSRINPSPYMYFLKFGKRRIVGSSPEMLLRVENRRAETFPIAGTAPRVANKKENDKITKELLADPKERAEHVMLVDLGRNDIGKVAKYGSVKVPELLTIQQYSHVQHIVSRVVGDLRDEFDSFDAMRAVFPAGTLSGAPKPRAMEIVEELEPTRRGPYGGALGYFSFNGNADFAITIRTLVADGNRCSIQAGGGVVADSIPEKEWEETENKAAGLFRAVEAAGGKK